MKPRCWGYKALDWFRFTPVASKLFYGGQSVKYTRKNITVTGIVSSPPDKAEDGDVTFGLQSEQDGFRHCEVTPCAPDRVRKIAQSLKAGDCVAVSGHERFDPPHVGGGTGWLEVHPVTDIVVVESATPI